MDVFIPLIALVIGCVIGFFVARTLAARSDNSQTVKQAEQSIKELLSQQAQMHLQQNKQALDNIEKQCQVLRQQLEDYQKVLAADDGDTPSVPFYGEQATTYLRNNLKEADTKHSHSVADSQPRDFANTGSGLFVGAGEQSDAKK